MLIIRLLFVVIIGVTAFSATSVPTPGTMHATHILTLHTDTYLSLLQQTQTLFLFLFHTYAVVLTYSHTFISYIN